MHILSSLWRRHKTLVNLQLSSKHKSSIDHMTKYYTWTIEQLNFYLHKLPLLCERLILFNRMSSSRFKSRFQRETRLSRSHRNHRASSSISLWNKEHLMPMNPVDSPIRTYWLRTVNCFTLNRDMYMVILASGPNYTVRLAITLFTSQLRLPRRIFTS